MSSTSYSFPREKNWDLFSICYPCFQEDSYYFLAKLLCFTHAVFLPCFTNEYLLFSQVKEKFNFYLTKEVSIIEWGMKWNEI